MTTSRATEFGTIEIDDPALGTILDYIVMTERHLTIRQTAALYAALAANQNKHVIIIIERAPIAGPEAGQPLTVQQIISAHSGAGEATT